MPGNGMGWKTQKLHKHYRKTTRRIGRIIMIIQTVSHQTSNFNQRGSGLFLGNTLFAIGNSPTHQHFQASFCAKHPRDVTYMGLNFHWGPFGGQQLGGDSSLKWFPNEIHSHISHIFSHSQIHLSAPPATARGCPAAIITAPPQPPEVSGSPGTGAHGADLAEPRAFGRAERRVQQVKWKKTKAGSRWNLRRFLWSPRTWC